MELGEVNDMGEGRSQGQVSKRQERALITLKWALKTRSWLGSWAYKVPQVPHLTLREGVLETGGDSWIPEARAGR